MLFGGGSSPTGSITVNSGAEILFLKGDSIGGAADATPNVTVTLNSGTLNDSATGGGLTFGNLNLNGGTVIANSDNFGNQYPSIYIRGSTITVAGSAESFIQQTQPANAGYNIRLDGTTANSGSDSNTFNVGVTGAAGGIDLAVSANLEDGYASNGTNLVNTTFIKTGAGTMSLSGSEPGVAAHQNQRRRA